MKTTPKNTFGSASTGKKHKGKKDKKGQDPKLPDVGPEADFPHGSDPSFEAQARAASRGLADLLIDTRRQKAQGKKDSRIQRQDIRQGTRRDLGDLDRSLTRGLQQIRQSRKDTRQDFRRGNTDYHNRIAELTRSYAIRATSQSQQANAAGVADASTQAASAAARARNFKFERAPLDLSHQRLGSDTQTKLNRIGQSADQLRTDTSQQENRINSDTAHDLRLNRIDLRRSLKDLRFQRQRARRENIFAQTDLTKQAAYNKHQLDPTAKF